MKNLTKIKLLYNKFNEGGLIMTEQQMAKEIVAMADLDLECFEDNLTMFSFVQGVDEMDALSLSGSNVPLWAMEFKPLVDKAANQIGCDVSTGNNFDLNNFSVFLDVLLHDTVSNGKFNTDNKKVLVPQCEDSGNYVENESIEILPVEQLGSRYIGDYYTAIVGAIKGYDNLGKETDEKADKEENTSEETKEEEKKETEEKKDTEEKVEDERLEGWGNFIDTLVNSVLAVQRDIYEGGFFIKPYGAMVHNGFITSKGNKKEKSLESFYDFISTKAGGVFNLGSSYSPNMMPSIENINKGVKYFPHYQLRNLLGAINGGVKTYSELENYLYKELTVMFKKEMLAYPRDIEKAREKEMRVYLNPLVEALKTVIAVMEYDGTTTLLVKVYAPNMEDISGDTIKNEINAGNVFSLKSDVAYFNKKEDLGTILMSIVLNTDSDSYPLFAYEALDVFKENGTQVSWKNVFLGRTVDNRPYFRDMSREFSNVIVAGSGSGKGVMTLNVLASAYGSGYPVFYLDGKPEMGETLYSIAQKSGLETFTFDCANGIDRGYNKLTDVERSLPELFKDKVDLELLANTMSYLRGMELFCLLCMRRGAIAKDKTLSTEERNAKLEALGGERVVCVFDEFEVFNTNVETVVSKLEGVYDTKTKGMTQKQKAEFTEESTYLREFRMYVSDVADLMLQGFRATFRVANCSLIFIFQHSNIKKSFGNNAIIIKLFKDLSGGSIRLFGRGVDSGDGSQVFGTANLCQPSKDLIGNRYFAISKNTSGSFTDDNTEVFKPYLVLNEATDTFANNIVGLDDYLKRKITDENGNWKKELGFLGYAEALLEIDIPPILNKSWVVAENLISEFNLAPSVCDFMYDVHNFDSIGKRIKPGYQSGSNPNEGEQPDYGGEYSEDGEANYGQADFGGFGNSSFDNEGTSGRSTQANTANNNEGESVFNNQETGNTYSANNNASTTQQAYTQEPASDFSNINQQKGTFNVNGQNVTPTVFQDYIFAQNSFNLTEESFMNEENTIDSLNNLSMVLYAQINDCIGESRVSSLIVKDRYIIVNNVCISPRITAEIAERLPFDIRGDISSGRYAEVFCFMLTRHFPNLTTMTFDDVDFFSLKVLADYNLSCRTDEDMRKSLIKIFKINKNLRTLTVGRDKFTIDSLNNTRGNLSDDVKSARRARQIESATRSALPNTSKGDGVMGFYRNNNISTGAKVATTVGIGALTVLALSNPLGTLAVGAAAGKGVVSGTKTLAGKLKSGFKAFGDAFKNSL